MDPAKTLRRFNTLKPTHGACTLFDAAMVLLQMVVQVTVGAMAHGFPQLRLDSLGIGVMTVTGDTRWDTAGNGACGPEEGFRCRAVAPLTQQDIDQVPIAIAA
jgi:hypothetical protein